MSSIKMHFYSCVGCTPVIQATWEAETEGLQVLN